jgi:hypothetical protein
MTVEKYPASSPYASSNQQSWRIGRYAHRDIPPASDDLVVVVETRHRFRPDLLSHDLYGSPAYWWVFAVRNPELRRDPVWALVPGLVISAPSRDYLSRVVGA